MTLGSLRCQGPEKQKQGGNIFTVAVEEEGHEKNEDFEKKTLSKHWTCTAKPFWLFF